MLDSQSTAVCYQPALMAPDVPAEVSVPHTCRLIFLAGTRQWTVAGPSRSATFGGQPVVSYMNSSPQRVQVLKTTPAKLYCLQDGHTLARVPQSMHFIESFDCHALRRRLGTFRGFDNMVDPLSKDPTI